MLSYLVNRNNSWMLWKLQIEVKILYFKVLKMFSTWWLKCISNQGYRTVLTFIIFRNIIRGLWLHFFLNTKIFNYKNFHYQPSGLLNHTKTQHKVYRLLQPMNSNQQLMQWLASNFIPKKSFKFKFSNPPKRILGSLPPPPSPKLNILSS